MHDATWRSEFGGTIYKTGGSHGCINLPHSVAKKIYENISAGMPVLCYNLEGTEKPSAPAKPQETEPSTQAPAPSEPSSEAAKPSEPAKPSQEAPSEPSKEQVQPTKPAETPAPTQPETTAPESPAGPASQGENSGPAGPGA